MDNILTTLTDFYASAPEQVMAAAFGFGALLLFVAVATIIRDRNPAAARIAQAGGTRGLRRQDRGLLLGGDVDPKGIMKGFIPTDREQRTNLQRKLAQAGYTGRDAIWNFTLVRIFFGLLFPALFLTLIFVSQMPSVSLPIDLGTIFAQLSTLHMVTILTTLTAFGYYVPTS